MGVTDLSKINFSAGQSAIEPAAAVNGLLNEDSILKVVADQSKQHDAADQSNSQIVDEADI